MAAGALGLCGLVAVGHQVTGTGATEAASTATGPVPAPVGAAAVPAGSTPGGGDAAPVHDPDGDVTAPEAASDAGFSDTAGGRPGGGTVPAVRIDSADAAPLVPGDTGWPGLMPSPALAGVPAQPPRSLTGAEGVEPFVLIGFSWAGPGETTARFRVHGASGWGAWRPLVRSTEHGPDPASSERAGGSGPAAGGDAAVGEAGPDDDRVAPGSVATDPVWVGPSDGWQLGLDGDAASVRVHLVRTAPATGTDPVAGAAGSATGPFGSQRTGAPGSAPLPTIGPWSGVVFAPALTAGPAIAERPQILPRSQWSARPPSSATWVATSLRLAVVHHTGSGESATYAPEDVPVMLRAEQAYHMDVNGWFDLGYNFVIDRFGRIWEGRDGGPATLTVGAHAEGMNTGSVGVALLGDFSAGAPSPEALASLGRLLAWKLFRHGADPARTGTMLPRVALPSHPALVPFALPRIVGHQDVNSTACPGNVEPLLPAVRADVQRRWSEMAAATTMLGDATVGPTPRGVPTRGDVDKDGDEDIIWYRPGPDRDELWRSTGEGGFVVTEFDIPDGGGAGARVTRLDWEGDGAVDLLVSTPGRATVTLVHGVPGGTVTMSSLAFSGNALPVVGDFDADGDDDILFYRSGITTLPLAEWDGGTGAIVTNLTLTGGPYRPVAADVDGDLRSDVLWYGPGSTADVLWTSQGGHAFGTRSVTMAGDYRPVAADLDGDQRDDIVWTTAAGGSMPVWFGGTTFTAATIDHGPTTQLTFGDIDGGGTDDVVAVAADGTATVWLRRPGAPWSPRREVVPAGAQPLVLDLDGDGRREILWWVDGGEAGLWRPI